MWRNIAIRPMCSARAEGKVLKQMLLDGEIDAAILGDVAEEGPIRHLIPDHEEAGRDWARGHGGVPINHLAVMRESIARERPDVVREVYRVLKESRAAAVQFPAGRTIRCALAFQPSGNRWSRSMPMPCSRS